MDTERQAKLTLMRALCVALESHGVEIVEEDNETCRWVCVLERYTKRGKRHSRMRRLDLTPASVRNFLGY